MKKRIWLPMMAVVTALSLTACLKNDDDIATQCTPNTLAQDQHVIDSFITSEGSSYLTYNSSYFGYIGVSNPGHADSSMAASDSIVAFKRVISTFKGSQLITVSTDSIYQTNTGANLVFSDFPSDSKSPYYYLLANSREGGSVRIIYPSSANALGFYGCEQQSLNNGTIIPAYSQVIFDVTLTGVKKNSY